MAAAKKQVNTWGAGDLGLDAGALAPRLTLEALFVPVVDTKVEIMEGETPEEQAMALATPAAGSEADLVDTHGARRGRARERRRTMANGVLILAELQDGKVAPVTQELVGAAQRLNAGPVSAMLIGSGVEARGVEDHRRREGVRRRRRRARGVHDRRLHAGSRGRREAGRPGRRSCSARRTSAATWARRWRSSSAPPSRWTRSRWR